jgi:hypothetical protein
VTSDGHERKREVNSEENKDLEKMQPFGGPNPKLLLLIAGTVILVALIALIVVLLYT